MSQGLLFIFAAPSGAGKTSLVKALLERDRRLRLSVSYTTRAARPGEQHGVHYHFIDHTSFERMLAENQFIEHAKVFDNYYGTAKPWLEEKRALGEDIVLEIDWQGARQVRKNFTDAIGVFILPPSRDTLEKRLRDRKQDSDEVIARRMQAAITEMSHYAEFDYLVVNDVFDTTLAQLRSIVAAERLRCSRQSERQAALLKSLLE